MDIEALIKNDNLKYIGWPVMLWKGEDGKHYVRVNQLDGTTYTISEDSEHNAWYKLLEKIESMPIRIG